MTALGTFLLNHQAQEPNSFLQYNIFYDRFHINVGEALQSRTRKWAGMKVFDVTGNVSGSGEYILGSAETGSHACYLIYGVLKAGEKGRELKPGHGHEEIVLVLAGELKIAGQYNGTLKQGQAIHLKGEESCLVENTAPAEAVYVISGGHSGHEHH